MNSKIQKVGFFLLVCYTLLLSFWMFFGFGRYTYPEFRYNLIPFSTIRIFLNFDQFNTNMWIINLIGNIGVFIPFGILLPLIIKGRIVLSYIFFIIGVFVLELIQMLSRRGSFDIDDLLLNSVGFVIGYGIYKIIILWLNLNKSTTT